MPAERGHSLVEVLVALGITALVVMLAAALLAELARSQHVHGDAEATTGSRTDVALDAVARDVRMAASVAAEGTPAGAVPATPGGATRSIHLLRDDGMTVSWERDGDVLRRTVDDGDDARSRVVLDDLLFAEFRASASGVVSIRLRRGGEPVRLRAAMVRNVDWSPPGRGRGAGP